MGNTFGASGLRGEANVSFSAELAFRFGIFFGRFAGNRRKRPRVLLGKDTRISGDMLESAITAGLVSTGVDVYQMHTVSTPCVSFSTREGGFDYGIMITASHNPYYDNGIKVIDHEGISTGEEVFRQFAGYLDGKSGELELAVRGNIGKVYDHSEKVNAYIKHLVGVSEHSLKGLRIGFDCANGAACGIAHKVFSSLGADVTFINDSPDGVNINAGCGSSNLGDIRNLVMEKGLDVGFALDGDADRCMASDENGKEVNGDHFSLIYAKYLKEKGRLRNNAVVGTIVSNMGLAKSLNENGIGYFISGVGEPVVARCMSDHQSVIGGEQCGHMVFSEYSNTGDGILTALKILDVMVYRRQRLSVLASELEVLPQITLNLEVNDKFAAMADPDVREIISRLTDELGSDGRILVRRSDTESLVRIMVESRDMRLCDAYTRKIAETIGEKGYAL